MVTIQLYNNNGIKWKLLHDTLTVEVMLLRCLQAVCPMSIILNLEILLRFLDFMYGLCLIYNSQTVFEIEALLPNVDYVWRRQVFFCFVFVFLLIRLDVPNKKKQGIFLSHSGIPENFLYPLGLNLWAWDSVETKCHFCTQCCHFFRPVIWLQIQFIPSQKEQRFNE